MSFSKNVIAKKRSIYQEFCKLCETFLGGNGSIASPWKCQCGVYEYDYNSNTYVLNKKEVSNE